MTVERPENSATIQWVTGNFQGYGSSGAGWAVCIVSGTVKLYNQLQGGSLYSVSIDIPSSVSVGQKMAITCYVSGSTITISVYDPSQSKILYNVVNSVHKADEKSILIGAKYSNNNDLKSKIKTILILNGDIGEATASSSTTGSAAHNELCSYLLTID